VEEVVEEAVEVEVDVDDCKSEVFKLLVMDPLPHPRLHFSFFSVLDDVFLRSDNGSLEELDEVFILRDDDDTGNDVDIALLPHPKVHSDDDDDNDVFFDVILLPFSLS